MVNLAPLRVRVSWMCVFQLKDSRFYSELDMFVTSL